jgi:hypothetical protein
MTCPSCKSTLFMKVGDNEVTCITCLTGYTITKAGDPNCPVCNGAGYRQACVTRLGVEVMTDCPCRGGSRYDPAAV